MNRFGRRPDQQRKRNRDNETPRSGTITSLVPQVHDQERLNVFIDGEFAFGVSELVATRAGLRVGKLLTALDVTRLRGEESVESAFESALNFLSYRARSEDEVRRNLEKKGITPETIEQVMERLKRTKLVDDDAFAGYWTKQRQMHSPRSARAIRYELRSKGVAADSIERALHPDPEDIDEASESAQDESTLAYRAAQKKAQQLARQGLDLMTFRRKLGGFLARRGFGYTTIAPVIRQLWQELGGASSDEDDTNTDTEIEFDTDEEV